MTVPRDPGHATPPRPPMNVIGAHIEAGCPRTRRDFLAKQCPHGAWVWTCATCSRPVWLKAGPEGLCRCAWAVWIALYMDRPRRGAA